DSAGLRAVADAALGVADVRAGRFLAGHLTQLAGLTPARVTEYVHHAARYNPDAEPSLAAFVGESKPDNVAERVKLFQALLRGLQERGAKPGRAAALALDQARRWLASEATREVRGGIDLAATLRRP